jgi:hypothetical protein
MRRWVSAFVVLAALAFAPPALADSPVEVYNDFASDGTLSCGHSRAALKGALNDASLQQYGDPLTSVQMKLAIRKQLAGGCRVLASVTPTRGTSSDPGESSPGAGSNEQTNKKQESQKQAGDSGSEQSTRQAAAPLKTTGSADGKHSGGMILLGISLLLLALGSGGWAARRAFGDRG